ncbi:MAG TPA: hypothetical protein VLI46_03655 [Ramlibacter sp.]|nr:hypothetical protein [Ramlibacter sp.]
MTELPVFRLGLAGFSPAQQEEARTALRRLATGACLWELGDFEGSDALWVNGARLQLLGQQRVRVAPGMPSDRSLQLHLPEVDRPVAFARPVTCRDFEPACSFELESSASVSVVLARFDAWLSPVAAQFFLASHIVEHQTALGSGVFEVTANGRLLALVDMHGETAVMPTAGPSDFDEAVWRRPARPTVVPDTFARASLAQLMWQYAVRTQRDLLPRHYRTGSVYFRRPPRLHQRMIKDSHLLLMRELAAAPATFDALQRRTGFSESALARDLAALYFVGTITSNPKRAISHQRPRRDDTPDMAQGPSSNLPSSLDSVPPSDAMLQLRGDADQTAPAPLRPN